jgi:ketosteroid isomerase-like protein
MSQENVETLRGAYGAFNRGDWDAATGFADPDFELKTAARAVNPGTYRGRDAARRFFEDLFEPFDEVVIEPEEFFERDDQVAVFLRVRMRPSDSSAFVENRIGHLWTMREGKVTRLAIFPRREEALETLGLLE